MANIRKTFNFREGVKVDDSVLVVAGERVGIGTTVPAQVLDVRGRVTITGDIDYSNSTTTGISTFAEVRLGTGVTISSLSGVITATSYYGDGSTLSNLPTSQWVDMDVGLGFTSIYNRGNVGVGTTDPRHTFQVGSNPDDSGKKGVGINSETGNIKSSGIITATSFVGSLTGNSSGNVTASYLNVTGVSTFSDDVNISEHAGIGSITVTGVSTFTGQIDGNGGADISGGETTLSSATVSDLTSGRVVVAGTSGSLDDSSNLTFDGTNKLAVTGGLTVSAGATFTSLLNSTDLLTSTVGSFGSNGSSAVGIGTTNPIAQLQILSEKDTSNDGLSRIVLGRGKALAGNNGAIAFGNTSVSFPYSGGTSLDILNYGQGNVNFYLEAGSTGVSTGDFHWHRRGNYSRLMSLTYSGSLGIGITQPVNTLHVVGTSTVTNKAYFGSDVEFGDNDISRIGSITANSITVPSVSATLTGNVNSASGISTFNSIEVNSDADLLGTVGIGTTATNDYQLRINNTASTLFTVADTGVVGIKTDVITTNGINCVDGGAIFAGVGIGTTNNIRAVADFADAGTVGVTTTNRFMLPPKVTTTERNAIAAVVAGAIVYNTTSNMLQCYNGTVWQDLF
tara:strand:- start:3993 stop:5858 length:1866 start_codon:yes stop_codon:yes gene_type:complete